MTDREMWFASEDEERWSCTPQFETREAAIAYGRSAFEGSFWVGSGSLVTVEQFGRWASDEVCSAIDRGEFEEEEELGADDAVISRPSEEEENDLTRILADWCDRHKLLSAWWNLSHIEQVNYSQREEEEK